MANDKQGMARDADHSSDKDPYYVPESQERETGAAAEPRQSKCMQGLAHNIHLLTFFPIILISVLSGFNLLLATVLCTLLVVLIIVLSYICFRQGYVKVFPKPFDIFNLCLYGSMIPLSVLAHNWLATYMGLLTTAANTVFMWAAILLPCSDNFVMHTVRDRIPEPVVSGALVKRMALLTAATWAVALTVMTAGTAIPIIIKHNPQLTPSTLSKVATLVLVFGPLVVAVLLTFVITHVYKKKITEHYQQLQQQQQATADAAVRLEEDQQGVRKGQDAV